ncbi:MAG: hydroxymyristoyl-ACP dehydratase [Bacteroidales bacterium]|nr:hydroxymyristoyl-ACP dehydratase [Bacteroidales bacterium]MCD8394935.1 hydroxymyristoyl-ACP dehydratase [Bacteroidales bacterium]
MKLKNFLYKIEAKETLADGEARVSLVLLPDCPIYEAHFPGQPITPGVCIIQMVKEMAEGFVGQELSIPLLKNAKFLQVITPNGLILSALFHIAKSENDTYKIKAEIIDDKVTYAKLSLQATCA